MIRRFVVSLFLLAGCAALDAAAVPAASRLKPNLIGDLDRPLRYRPDGADFVIENGTEFFNRALYGGNTAFRVDGGDRPEFVLYLPGRGGNLRFALARGGRTLWLHDAAQITTRYRPGQLLYEIADPLLGAERVLRLAVIAPADREGLIARVELAGAPDAGRVVGGGAAPPLAAELWPGAESRPDLGQPMSHLEPPLELLWAYGGVNGQRGRRDGDIGTETVPISEWFQLRPEFCRDNAITLGSESFTLRAKSATIAGVMPVGSQLAVVDAANWNELPALLASARTAAASEPARPADRNSKAAAQPAGHLGRDALVASDDHDATRASRPQQEASRESPEFPLVIGRCALPVGQPLFIGLHRLAPAEASAAAAEELDTYREVTAPRTETAHTSPQPGGAAAPPSPKLPTPAPWTSSNLPRIFAEAERHFRELRQRVQVETPDPFLNAAVGALNVAADAAWDEPQQAIMHGAIAWRTRLLGWRGAYALDALGWHDRFQRNVTYWAGRQNLDPIPPALPPADENANLARNETGLHSNGDMSNSHYDMNLVAIDALFRHLQWTGDLAFAEKMWPVIERHLAWERRLFRREFGPERLPLYEAYAAIWASDDLQYHGGGVMHASAYNYFHNVQAARLARLLGRDPEPYAREAELLAHGMRELLWLPERGHFAEFKDLLGLQRVHPSAALWTFYHTMDSAVPTPREAWTMTRQVDTQIPHLPVRGPGVPEGLHVLSTTNWMPYTWSINNVVLPEVVHTALGFWQAGRPEEAWTLTRGSLLAAMFMGIAPGNVGSMSYLDVYRRESQRDFADSSGVLSRALVEGLFGLKPDLLAGELRVEPGFPAAWDHASLRHPDLSLRFRRDGDTDHYVITQRFAQPQALRLVLTAPRDRVGSLAVNGDGAEWQVVDDAVGAPRIVITSRAGFRHEVLISWAGEPIAEAAVDQFPCSCASNGADRTAQPCGHADGESVVAGVGDPGQPGSASPATGAEFVERRQGQMRWWEPKNFAEAPTSCGCAGDGAVGSAPPCSGPGENAAPETLGTALCRDLDAAPEVSRHKAAPTGTPCDSHRVLPPSGGRRDEAASPPAAQTAGRGLECELSAPGADAVFDCVDLTPHFNDRVTQIFRNEYRSPRSPFVSLAIPKQGIGGWAGGVNASAEIDDSGLRAHSDENDGRIVLPNGVPLATPGSGRRADAPSPRSTATDHSPDDRTAEPPQNIVFTSLWDNYPDAVAVPLAGRARAVVLLLAGSTNHMQSRFENGEIVVRYRDGTTARLPLENPTNWWPIEQDYFIDDYQFRRPEPLPVRVDLKTGRIRVLEFPAFKGQGRRIPGGAATVLELALDPGRDLAALEVRALANEVVIGLMAATLVR